MLFEITIQTRNVTLELFVHVRLKPVHVKLHVLTSWVIKFLEFLNDFWVLSHLLWNPWGESSIIAIYSHLRINEWPQISPFVDRHDWGVLLLVDGAILRFRLSWNHVWWDSLHLRWSNFWLIWHLRHINEARGLLLCRLTLSSSTPCTVSRVLIDCVSVSERSTRVKHVICEAKDLAWGSHLSHLISCSEMSDALLIVIDFLLNRLWAWGLVPEIEEE